MNETNQLQWTEEPASSSGVGGASSDARAPEPPAPPASTDAASAQRSGDRQSDVPQSNLVPPRPDPTPRFTFRASSASTPDPSPSLAALASAPTPSSAYQFPSARNHHESQVSHDRGDSFGPSQVATVSASASAPSPHSAAASSSAAPRPLGTGRFADDLSALGPRPSDASSKTAPLFELVPESALPSRTAVFAPSAGELNPQGTGRQPIEEIAELSSSDGFLFGDPLVRSPRTSTIVLNLLFAVLFLAGFVGVYWLGVHTVDGQRYDDLVWLSLQQAGVPSVLDSSANPWSFAYSPLVIGASAAVALIALIIAAFRRRWWLIGQMVVFGGLCVGGAEALKEFLPREQLDPSLNNPANTLPSGHAVMAAAAMAALLLALPRVLRWVGALLGAVLASGVGVAVIVGQWHRPSDVVAALMLVGGLAFLALAFTHGSGMDRIGTRRSSVPLQIVAPVMITAGVMGQLYATYLIWQLQPGLALKAGWAVGAAQISAIVLVVATASLMFGLLAAMRQISACPLSKAGRVGEPPAPPSGQSQANAIEVRV